MKNKLKNLFKNIFQPARKVRVGWRDLFRPTVFAFVMCIAFSVNAQIATGTNQVTNLLPSNPYTQLARDLWAIAKPVMPATNDTYILSLGVGENTSSHHLIEAGMLSIQNTNGTGVSLIGGKIGSEWKYGGGAFSLGRQDNWPIVGTVQESIGDGVIYDWVTHEPANYVFTRFSKDWMISKWDIGIGAVIANRSNESGVDAVIGAHVGCTF